MRPLRATRIITPREFIQMGGEFYGDGIGLAFT